MMKKIKIQFYKIICAFITSIIGFLVHRDFKIIKFNSEYSLELNIGIYFIFICLIHWFTLCKIKKIIPLECSSEIKDWKKI